MNKGEVAVGIYFEQKYDVKIGERLVIEKGGNELRFGMKGLLGDGEMKRSVVS
ncbi:hypothetical protein [Bacillus sp. WP8]|uniref:hypothetical protein n=1 Tax=Bacillus sp. WP8 TaxID=756828 RepID=UPI001642C648|nr:hypothetical protein [Bacillus sp. WP8]